MDKYAVSEGITEVENYHKDSSAYFKTYVECFISEKLKSNEIWEKFLHDVFEKYITKNSIVIEGGAHIGTHSVKLSKLAKLVYCFEPLKHSYQLLEENLILNDCNNVVISDRALSNNVGHTCFKWESYRNLGASALMGTDMDFKEVVEEDNPEANEVRLTTIDEMYLPDLNFIKLDVEGFETKAIEGGIRTIQKFKPVIALECYSSEGSTPSDEEIEIKFKPLLGMGYRYERLEHHTDLLFLPI